MQDPYRILIEIRDPYRILGASHSRYGIRYIWHSYMISIRIHVEIHITNLSSIRNLRYFFDFLEFYRISLLMPYVWLQSRLAFHWCLKQFAIFGFLDFDFIIFDIDRGWFLLHDSYLHESGMLVDILIDIYMRSIWISIWNLL